MSASPETFGEGDNVAGLLVELLPALDVEARGFPDPLLGG
jgi:hypothetical protein